MSDLTAWGVELAGAICETCDWVYLLPATTLAAGHRTPVLCPHCFQTHLTRLDTQVDRLPYVRPPELLLPFTVSAAVLAETIRRFASGIPFAPADLKFERLQTRLQQLYLPMWLVDSEVRAIWQAEAGFNYQVVSHQDSYNENSRGWVSHQLTETRVRWEPRLGRLARTYQNLAAPALEEDARLKEKLGGYNLQPARPYQPDLLASAFVRLPDRSPEAAWPGTLPGFQTAAAEECRLASQADAIRSFRWQPEYTRQNWTLLLLPVYTTYYLDDERCPHPLLISGQTGTISGSRRASSKQAGQMALVIGGVAALGLLASLLALIGSLIWPRLAGLAAIGLVVTILIGLLAVVPIVIAWHFNESQPGDPA